ncbi:MAG: hypothetical protein JWN20_472 [Jatrophihabitantaceae bacterium]|nr:hypothetical protein [Jatrophihabitantaceae bacterium]
MSTARDEALAALAAVIESGAALAKIVHAASRLADAQMAETLAGRAAIEQAKGIVMCGQRCTPDEAFEVLKMLSQAQNRNLRDVAQALVGQSGEQSSD